MAFKKLLAWLLSAATDVSRLLACWLTALLVTENLVVKPHTLLLGDESSVPQVLTPDRRLPRRMEPFRRNVITVLDVATIPPARYSSHYSAQCA
jgi:hypothetical protein